MSLILNNWAQIAFDVATWLVQFLFYLNPKFQTSTLFLDLVGNPDGQFCDAVHMIAMTQFNPCKWYWWPSLQKSTILVPTRSDTNQPQKKARSLKFLINQEEGFTICVAKIGYVHVITAQLFCILVFAYEDCWFSGAAAHMTKTL